MVEKSYYHNKQKAKETSRGDETNHLGAGSNKNKGKIYKNNQKAKETLKETLINSEYKGGIFTGTKKYVEQTDKTRSGIHEETLVKDYYPSKKYDVESNSSRESLKNFNQIERKENAIDISDRKIMGGTGQISFGKEDIGKYNTLSNRENNTNKFLKKKLIPKNYIKELNVSGTRSKILIEPRSNISKNILKESLKGNPYINNLVFKSESKP